MKNNMYLGGFIMDMAPEFIGKPISLDGSRRLHELKVKATEMLSLIQETKPSNENARMIALARSEEHTSELQSHSDLVCRLLLEKKKKKTTAPMSTTIPNQHSRE